MAAASAQRFSAPPQTILTNILVSALQEFTDLPNSFLDEFSPGKVPNSV